LLLTDLPYHGIAQDFCAAGSGGLGRWGGFDVFDLGLGELLLDGWGWGAGDKFVAF